MVGEKIIIPASLRLLLTIDSFNNFEVVMVTDLERDLNYIEMYIGKVYNNNNFYYKYNNNNNEKH